MSKAANKINRYNDFLKVKYTQSIGEHRRDQIRDYKIKKNYIHLKDRVGMEILKYSRRKEISFSKATKETKVNYFSIQYITGKNKITGYLGRIKLINSTN